MAKLLTMSDLLTRLARESAHFDELNGNLSRIESTMRTIGDRIYLLRARYACISARFAHVGERLAVLEELVHERDGPAEAGGRSA